MVFAALLAVLACMNPAQAQTGAEGGGGTSTARAVDCSNYSPLETMFKDVCWSGMFPFRLMGATFMDGKSGVPTDA